MPNFRLERDAGSFKKGAVVSEKDIKDSGADLEFWKSSGAVVPVTVIEGDVSTTDPNKPSGEPAPGDGNALTGPENPDGIALHLLSPEKAERLGLVKDADGTHWVKPVEPPAPPASPEFQPIPKDQLKPAEAKEQNLVLNPEKTHWVKPVEPPAA